MAVQVTVLSIDDEQLSAPKKSVFTKADISIGRSRLNDLVLEHPGVSNTHARVRIEGVNGSSKFFVSDLDSTNGTMVGNKRLDPRSETALTERDRIMIAGFILKIDTVPEDLIFTTDSEPQTVVASAEPKLAEGKITNSFARPQAIKVEEPKVEEVAVVEEIKKTVKEEVPNGTVWNSSLLGAYREQPVGPKAAPVAAAPIAEPEPVKTEAPRKPSGVHPISWPMESDEVAVPEAAEVAPEYVAETKLILEDHLTVDFVATKLLTINGKVLRKGQPVANVKVSDAELGSTETDASGEFSFSDIVEGTDYKLSFEKAGHVFLPGSLVGSLNDENLAVEIVAKRLLSITGAITHRGAGLADVLVDGGKLGVVKTDNMGLYKFDNAMEGEEYILKASKPGFTFGTLKKSAQ
jgi:pSer/pThr/pTyr-binding forkhead associated (FHA) protein